MTLTISAELTANAIAKLNHKLFQEEPALYQTKWWDYRFIHPTQATQLFSESYKTAMSLWLRKRDDRKTYYCGIQNPTLFLNGSRVITGMWKARQMADRFGINYSFYCTETIRYCDARKWHYLPKSWQLYSTSPTKNTINDISMVEHVVNEWRDLQKSCPRRPEESFYKASEYVGHIYQRQYQKSLIERVKKHPNRTAVICDLVYDAGLLIPDLVKAVYGEEQLSAAYKLSKI